MLRISTSLLLLLTLFGLAACNTGVRKANLENRTWILTSYQADGTRQTVPDQDTRLQFGEDDLSGSTGCNRIDGRYDLKKSRLTTAQFLTTEMACPGKMEREAHLLDVLNNEPTLAMDGDNLLMSHGETVLTFRLSP